MNVFAFGDHVGVSANPVTPLKGIGYVVGVAVLAGAVVVLIGVSAVLLLLEVVTGFRWHIAQGLVGAMSIGVEKQPAV